MNFKVRKFDLQNELAVVVNLIDRKADDEVRRCVLIKKIDDSTIVLAGAQDILMMQTSIKVDAPLIPNDDPGPSAFAVDAGKLLDLCKKLPDAIVDLTFDGTSKKMLLRCGSSRYTLALLDGSLFPAIRMPDVFTSVLPLKFFHRALRDALPLIEGSEVGMIYNSGGSIILADGALDIVGTDGTRMSLWTTTMDTDRKFGLVLPKRTMTQMVAVLEGFVGKIPQIEVELQGSLAYFRFGKYTYQSATMSGTFPNYVKMIEIVSTQAETNYTIPRVKFMQCLERALIFSGKNQGSGVNMEFKTKEMVVSTANENGESSFDMIEVNCPKPHQIRLNGSYLISYLSGLSDDTVDLWLDSTGKNSGIYFRVASERNYKYVMMRMGWLG